MGEDDPNERGVRADLRDEFLSVVSHELRTPLTSILGFTEMTRRRLERDVVPRLPKGDPKLDKALAKMRESLQVTIYEGRRLTDLVNTVLDLHKMRAGLMEWKHESVDLLDVIRFCAGSCSVLLMEKPGLQIDLQLREDEARVRGDRDRLLEACTHLLSNAISATATGTITLVLEREPDQRFRVEVRDTGCGIPAAELAHLFEVFYRTTDEDQKGGSGLGLAITREIVHAHGGTIQVESTERVGTTFTVFLPSSV